MTNTDSRSSTGDIDIVALMRRLVVAYPEEAATAVAATSGAAAPGGATAPGGVAPAAPAVPVTTAPAPGVVGEGLSPVAAVFCCPSCRTVHNLVPAPIVPNPPPAPPPANNTPVAPAPAPAPPAPNALATPAPAPLAQNTLTMPAPAPPAPNALAGPPPLVRTGHFSAATGIYGDRWYAVIVGREVGVFQDWRGVVEPLTRGVHGWLCKAFATFDGAEQHLLDNMHIARIRR